MVESYKLLCVVAIVETVGGSGGCIGVIIVGDTVISCPATVNNADTPEAMVRVAPPLESCGMEEYFTSGIA